MPKTKEEVTIDLILAGLKSVYVASKTMEEVLEDGEIKGREFLQVGRMGIDIGAQLAPAFLDMLDQDLSARDLMPGIKGLYEWIEKAKAAMHPGDSLPWG